MIAEISDDVLREQIGLLSNSDRALCRTNPFAVQFSTGSLVTADQVAASPAEHYGSHFVCPKCSGDMRHFIGAKGTPFFAHAAARGSCPSGIETPAHLCIKRGLRSIGFVCEYTDTSTGYRFDAYHNDTDTIAEVISSGTGRYDTKISSLRASGRRCWYIVDSGSRSLGSRDGSESICMRSFRNSGTVIVSGLFKPRAVPLLSSIAGEELFAFYYGLIWQSCGADRWVLIDDRHPLSQAATADDGMKHLMVKMHAENAVVVTENKRKGVDRRTWFDKAFRYRGNFTTNWQGDRDYIVELVATLVKDAEAVSLATRKGMSCGSHAPSDPVHASADDLVAKINERHAASLDEAKRLRAIAEQSQVTRKLAASEIASASPSPVVVDASDISGRLGTRQVRSSRFDKPVRDVPSVHQINVLLQQIGPGTGVPQITGQCAGGHEHQTLVRQCGCIEWNECIRCGARGMSHVIDRRKAVRR